MECADGEKVRLVQGASEEIKHTRVGSVLDIHFRWRHFIEQLEHIGRNVPGLPKLGCMVGCTWLARLYKGSKEVLTA